MYRNPSEASTKLLKSLYTLRWSLQTTKSAITLDELWQEEPVSRLEKPQYTVKGIFQNRQPFQRQRISRMPRTTAKILCQNNNFFQKNWQKRSNFPKKWGHRITIPDNLIVCISQSIGGFHETSQIFTHAEIITSNDQKRDHTGWAKLRQEERNLCRDWKNHSTQGLCVIHRDIRYSVYYNPSETYKKLK